jgi:hypothetical protein
MADLVEQYADLPLGTTDARVVALAERMNDVSVATRPASLHRRTTASRGRAGPTAVARGWPETPVGGATDRPFDACRGGREYVNPRPVVVSQVVSLSPENRVRHADTRIASDLGSLHSVRHPDTLRGHLGVKGSRVQVPPARPARTPGQSRSAGTGSAGFTER